MAEGLSLRKGSVRTAPGIGAALLAVCIASPAASFGQDRVSAVASIRDPSAHLRFEEVDYGEIERRARLRGLPVPEEELGDFVRRNFQYVFWQCLNQRRFLVSPAPRRVADSMLEVLDLNAELTARMQEGRHLVLASLGDASRLELRTLRWQLVRQIKETSKDLKKAFRGTFVELQKSDYKLRAPSGKDPSARFAVFLSQAERISRKLTKKVDEYFFSSAPGAVAVQDFDDVSIGVLSEALTKLCEMNEKGLKP